MGQCTYYVASIYSVLQKTKCLGNACQWWPAAQNNGWYTSGNPYNGAVVVFDCSLPGSGGDGHVGVVSKVYSDGTFDMTSMNWVGWDRTDTHTVTTKSHIQGFFSPPGGPVPGSALSPGGSAGPVTGPATGARGLRCQVGVQIPSLPLGPGLSLGPWAICFDGLIGVLAIAGGVGIMALAVFLTVRKPLARTVGGATEVAGIATGQPEVIRAGQTVRRVGASNQPVRTGARQGARAIYRRGVRSATQRSQARAAVQGQEQARVQTQRTPRPRTADHMSVQEQETRRYLIGSGFSAVQATRGARAAGSAGTREERLTRGLRALAPQR